MLCPFSGEIVTIDAESLLILFYFIAVFELELFISNVFFSGYDEPMHVDVFYQYLLYCYISK